MKCLGGADPPVLGSPTGTAPRPASRSKASLSRHLEKGRRGRRPRTRGPPHNRRQESVQLFLGQYTSGSIRGRTEPGWNLTRNGGIGRPMLCASQPATGRRRYID